MRGPTITDIIEHLLDEFADRIPPKRIITAVKDARRAVLNPSPSRIEKEARGQLDRVAHQQPPRRAQTMRDPAARARAAGITAVWTGNCSATVELARLAGPNDAMLTIGSTVIPGCLPGRGPWRLSTPAVRVALYEYLLTSGTPHEIYRWVNLTDLAAIWNQLRLPTGVHHEWHRALALCGLLEPRPGDPTA